MKLFLNHIIKCLISIKVNLKNLKCTKIVSLNSRKIVILKNIRIICLINKVIQIYNIEKYFKPDEINALKHDNIKIYSKTKA